MKKKIIAILLLAILTCSFTSALAAYVRPFATPTWVRTGPGLSYKIFSKVYVGNTYAYKGSSTDSRGVKWYKISFSGGTGWVSSLHASLVSSSTGVDKKNSPYTSYGTHVTARKNTTVRAGAGTKYKKLGTLYRGERVTFTGTKKNGWYQIKFHGKSGWVKSSHVKKS